MTVQEMQLKLIEQVLKISNTGILSMLVKFLEKFNNTNEEEDDYLHPEGIPFEIWNKQFNDEAQLDKLDPEVGMTLREFRRMVWGVEQSETQPIDKLYKHLDARINDLKTPNSI